jgi:hypothetical protein
MIGISRQMASSVVSHKDASVRRRYRHREDKLNGITAVHDLQRDPHRGIGANAGIDDDSPAPTDFNCWTVLAIARR